MTTPDLDRFLDAVRALQGGLTTERLRRLRVALGALAAQGPSGLPVTPDAPDVVLHHDAESGPMLLAHLVTAPAYRPPHDHGRGWVVYAVVSGAMEIGTWAHVDPGVGTPRLVCRDRFRVEPGDVRVFLPGDIHDTRAITDSVRLLRFTSCDLAAERDGGRMQVFPNPDL